MDLAQCGPNVTSTTGSRTQNRAVQKSFNQFCMFDDSGIVNVTACVI